MPVAIAVAGIAVYLNSFQGAFLLDDAFHILKSDETREFANIWGSRPVVNFTLVVNYKLGEHAVFGYHLVNLLIHLAAALTLFGLIDRTIRLETLRERFGATGRWIAFVTALLWVVHPLQTESVTYVIQRGESLMGLCYLLTLYCTVRGAGSARGRWWFGAAVVACSLGMGSKTVMVTAPLLVLLYDRIFLSGSFKTCVRERGLLHGALAATWLVPVFTGVAQAVLNPGVTNKNVGFGSAGLSSLDYFLSQPGVLLHYLRLSFWPHPLCLDYGWPVAQSALAIAGPGLVLTALFVGTLWLLWKRPHLGFVAASFFVVLGPTSSIVPIRDIAFEHRMYLPLAAVVLFVVLGARRLLAHAVARGMIEAAAVPSIAVTLIVAATGLLGWRTVERNRDYRSDTVMWGDVVDKRPDNARGRSNYGVSLLKEARLGEARPHFEAALALKPDDPVALNNISLWLLTENRVDDAIESMIAAIRADSRGAAEYNLANLLAREGGIDDTIRRYQDRGVPLDDVHVEAWMIAGDLHLGEGRPGMALEAWQRAQALDPDNPDLLERLKRLAPE